MDSLELGVACREKNLRPRSSAAGRHFDPTVYFYKDQILELYKPALVALNQHILASFCSWKLRESQPPSPAQLHRDGAVQFPPNQLFNLYFLTARQNLIQEQYMHRGRNQNSVKFETPN